jgi:predicted DNA-binding protein
MSPEKQRIAIARACGEDNDSIVRELIPDYLNDLNAMHEAEKVLTQEQDYQYRASILPAVCKDGSGMIAMTAPAAQRAKAFLRTIGKWEGAK